MTRLSWAATTSSVVNCVTSLISATRSICANRRSTQSEVATGDAHDAAEDARVGPVQFESQTKLERWSSDDVLQLGPPQRHELVDDPDARIQLRVPCQTLLEARHANQHRPMCRRSYRSRNCSSPAVLS